MIIWDFNVIVALLITLALGVVFSLWIYYTLGRGRTLSENDREYFRQCAFCGYLYFDYFKRKQGACPRCGSYQS